MVFITLLQIYYKYADESIMKIGQYLMTKTYRLAVFGPPCVKRATWDWE